MPCVTMACRLPAREVPVQERAVSERKRGDSEPVDPAEGRDIPRGTDEHAESTRTPRDRTRDGGVTSSPSEHTDDPNRQTT